MASLAALGLGTASTGGINPAGMYKKYFFLVFYSSEKAQSYNNWYF